MSKFHGVLTSCRVKRAPRSAGFPNLWSKAYESVSECSRRPHIDEQGAKNYAFQKQYRMWWKMLNNFYVPSLSKATFYCCKRTTGNIERNSGQKNSGAPSQVIKDLTRSPTIYYWFSTIWMKRCERFFTRTCQLIMSDVKVSHVRRLWIWKLSIAKV